MPYQGERANKMAHADFVKNPDVARFLEECEYLREPTDEEIKEMSNGFVEPPSFDDSLIPERVVAIDGSLHESSINDRLPSTKIGYVKIGSVLIEAKDYRALRVSDGKFVDPFKVAKLQDNSSPLTFTLPSANIKWNGNQSVQDSFRAMVDHALHDNRTRMIDGDPSTSLRSTLFLLASLRPDEMGTGDVNRLRIHKCPSCGVSGEKNPIELKNIDTPQYCPQGCRIYPSDCLRIWEEVSDYQSNLQAISRFMSIIEHMMPIHYIRFLSDNSASTLASLAFFIDGPLAVFGNAAWIHGSILRYLHQVNQRLRSMGCPDILVIGLQKTGQVVDHCNLIDKYIEPNKIYAISDEYRYRYILGGRDPARNGFGYETYYGQDFIFKTKSGRLFVMGLPYFDSKKVPSEEFLKQKIRLSNYTNLPRALALIDHFESDLYKNAVVPVALAHKYTAISFSPGGRVLDILTRRGLEAKD